MRSREVQLHAMQEHRLLVDHLFGHEQIGRDMADDRAARRYIRGDARVWPLIKAGLMTGVTSGRFDAAFSNRLHFTKPIKPLPRTANPGRRGRRLFSATADIYGLAHGRSRRPTPRK